MNVTRSAFRLAHALRLHWPLSHAACKNTQTVAACYHPTLLPGEEIGRCYPGPPIAIPRVARKRLEHGDAKNPPSVQLPRQRPPPKRKDQESLRAAHVP